jgi:hypothetical protein
VVNCKAAAEDLGRAWPCPTLGSRLSDIALLARANCGLAAAARNAGGPPREAIHLLLRDSEIIRQK